MPQVYQNPTGIIVQSVLLPICHRHLPLYGADEDVVFSFANVPSGNDPNTLAALERLPIWSGIGKKDNTEDKRIEQGIWHLRFRKDAIVLSRLWSGVPYTAEGNFVMTGIDFDASAQDPDLAALGSQIGALYDNEG